MSLYMAEHTPGEEKPIIPRDGDTKFTARFDAILKDGGVEPHRITFRSPNLNAYAERFAQTLQVEALDHFVVLGEKHLEHIVSEFLAHHNQERPHQSLGNVPLTQPSTAPPAEGKIVCQERLGGLLRHYHRQAA